MTDLRYTLVSDGSSDQALLPLISWSLRGGGVVSPIRPAWADLSGLRQRPSGLKERIRAALSYYPCELLLVHRDCETQEVATRQNEIRIALDEVFGSSSERIPAVCVVPRRMTEAWLLISERAIRMAAGNPSGRTPLLMPVLNRLEDLPDPKEVLFSLFRTASELHGRRLRSLRVRGLIYRLVELIDDFSPLRNLPAFVAFEQQLGEALQQIDAE